MKVAVCISGCLRKFKSAYPYLKENILDKLDCDIFMSSWAGTDSNHTGMYSDEGTSQEFIELYKPKAFEFNSYSDGDPAYEKIKNISQETTYWLHGVAWFFNLWNCGRLKNEYAKQNNVTYDLVVITRPDCVITSSLNSSCMTEAIHNPVYFTHIKNHPRQKNHPNDIFGLCNNEVHATLCQIVNRLDYLQQGGTRFDKGEYLYNNLKKPEHFCKYIFNETMMMNQLFDNNITIKDVQQEPLLFRDSGPVAL